MKAPKILVVGSINKDIIFYKPHVNEFERNGCAVFETCAHFNGGKGGNQASAASRLGAKTWLVSAVGRDSDGQQVLKGLEDNGVHTEFIEQREDTQTGLSAIFIMPDSSYYGTNVLGANKEICPEMVENAMTQVDFDMVLMQLEMPLETVYRTYELAKERNIPVILDAGPAKSIPMDRLRGIFMVTPNEAETTALTGVVPQNMESFREAAEILMRKTDAKYILLKLGGMGAYLYDGKNEKMYPSFKTICIDSTGAGDSFTTAMMIQLCMGKSIDEAIIFGNAAGAICVSRKGGQESIPTMEEIQAFIEENK